MSWLLSYYTRQGFHVVSVGNMLFMVFNIQMRSQGAALNRYPVPEWVLVPSAAWVHQQVYLHRYPKELMLRNHV